MTSSFRIQWHDPNSNYSGSFRGREARGDDWRSLDDFRLAAGSTFDFYLSVVEGVEYVTFVTLKIDDDRTYGARVPPLVHDDQGDGNQDAIALGPVTLGRSPIEVRASVLISDDPKVHVTWGKGGTENAIVQLIWTGDGWTDANGDPVADTLDIDTLDSLTITVSDRSQHASMVAVYQAQRLVGELLENAIGQLSIVLAQPSGVSETTYTVNLFDRLPDAGTLAVG